MSPQGLRIARCRVREFCGSLRNGMLCIMVTPQTALHAQKANSRIPRGLDVVQSTRRVHVLVPVIVPALMETSAPDKILSRLCVKYTAKWDGRTSDVRSFRGTYVREFTTRDPIEGMEELRRGRTLLIRDLHFSRGCVSNIARSQGRLFEIVVDRRKGKPLANGVLCERIKGATAVPV
jgi:hypothetical protein